MTKMTATGASAQGWPAAAVEATARGSRHGARRAAGIATDRAAINLLAHTISISGIPEGVIAIAVARTITRFGLIRPLPVRICGPGILAACLTIDVWRAMARNRLSGAPLERLRRTLASRVALALLAGSALS